MGVFLPVKTMSALVNRWYERGEAEKEHGHRGEGDLYSGGNQMEKGKEENGEGG